MQQTQQAMMGGIIEQQRERPRVRTTYPENGLAETARPEGALTLLRELQQRAGVIEQRAQQLAGPGPENAVEPAGGIMPMPDYTAPEILVRLRGLVVMLGQIERHLSRAMDQLAE